MAKKLIETPEIMWSLFEGYKADIKKNPILVQDFVGKDGDQVQREKQRPLTMEGFECYAMDNTEITFPELSAYFSDKNNAYGEFYSICSRIRREIRRNQIEGGMAGIFNPSITQRLNALKETTVLEAAEQPLFPKVDKQIEESNLKIEQ